jgi:hypothetical protein
VCCCASLPIGTNNAQLVALLSGALRHVAEPTVAPGAYRYHDTVRINLYDVLLRDATAAAGASASGASRRDDDTPGARFDADAFRAGAAALLLPGQALQFTAQRLDAAEDAALGGGIAASLRTAAAPQALPGGGVASVTHRYLDTAELRRQLGEAHARRRKRPMRAGAGGTPGSGAADELDAGGATNSVLEVPIFIITAQGGPPLFVDAGAQHTAASMPELVVAVASPHTGVPSGVACSEGPLLRDLSDALAPALAALAAHLGGAAALHAGGAADGSADDYAWGAGAHPLAATASAGAAGSSQIAADVVHRSYLVTALDASIDDANIGIAALSGVRTDGGAWAAYGSRAGGAAAAEVLSQWTRLVAAWRAAAEAGAALNYRAAADACGGAERAGARFRAAAEALAALLHPARCAAAARGDAGGAAWHARVPWQPLVLAAMALAAVAVCVQLARPRRYKPKLN